MSEIIYSHNDLDGLCSAAIAADLYPNAEVKILDYPEQFDKKDVQGKDVFLLDYSFEDMDTLASVCKTLTWIDHHASAMNKHPDLWKDYLNVRGERGIEHSACELTYMYFYDEYIPDIVRLIGDMDLFKFEDPTTDPFCAYAEVELTTYDNPLWMKMIEGTPEGSVKMAEFFVYGQKLQKARAVRVEKAFASGTDLEFKGHKVRLVNSRDDTSYIGERIYSDIYDLAIIWHMKGDEMEMHFYSASDGPDVSKIAEIFGGGGHAHAAGANINFELGMDILWGEL